MALKTALDMGSACEENLNINQKMVGYSHDRYPTIVPVGMEISKEPWGLENSKD